MEFARNRKDKKAINIISLIDVLFFLAIFLMLCTSFVKTQAIDVSVANKLDGTEPVSKLSGAIDSEEVNTVNLMVAAKTVSLNNVRYRREDLAAVMKEKIREDPARRINIEVEQSANVQNLIDVIDVIRLQGASNLTIRH